MSVKLLKRLLKTLNFVRDFSHIDSRELLVAAAIDTKAVILVGTKHDADRVREMAGGRLTAGRVISLHQAENGSLTGHRQVLIDQSVFRVITGGISELIPDEDIPKTFQKLLDHYRDRVSHLEIEISARDQRIGEVRKERDNASVALTKERGRAETYRRAVERLETELAELKAPVQEEHDVLAGLLDD